MTLFVANRAPLEVSSYVDAIPSGISDQWVAETRHNIQSGITELLTKVELLDATHTKQVISVADIKLFKALFPTEVDFINSLPFTVTPTATSLSTLITYLYEVVEGEIKTLAGDLRGKYSVLFDDSKVLSTLLAMFAYISPRTVRLCPLLDSKTIDTLINTTLRVVPGTNLPVSKGTTIRVNYTVGADVREHIRYNLETANNLITLARTMKLNEIAGLHKRLAIVQSVLPLVQCIELLPLWRDTLMSIPIK